MTRRRRIKRQRAWRGWGNIPTRNVVGDPFGAFSPGALALFEAMEVQPDATRKALIDTFIKALVAGSVWNLLDALYVFAAHTEQAALLNWKAPGTFDGTVVDAPTFTEDEGFAGNGSTSYVTTNFNPTTASSPAFVQDSACMGVWVLTSRAGADKVVMANAGVGGGCNIFPRFTDDKAYLRLNDNSEAEGFAVADSAGLLVANRSSSTARQGYRNGVSIGTYASNTSAAPNNSAIAVGRANAGGGGFSDDAFSMALLGGSLSAGLQVALYDAALVYMQAVGAV